MATESVLAHACPEPCSHTTHPPPCVLPRLRRITHPSGDVYEGQWHANLKHGKGRFEFVSGDVYEGEYKEGLQHGRAKFM